MAMCACLCLSVCTRLKVCAPTHRLAAPPPSPLTRPCPAGLLENKAQIVVTVGAIRGLVDYSLWDPEPGPHGPFITYSYYVTYDFVEDEENMKDEFERVLAEVRPGLHASGGMGSPSAWVFLLMSPWKCESGAQWGTRPSPGEARATLPSLRCTIPGGAHPFHGDPLMETRGCISPTVWLSLGSLAHLTLSADAPGGTHMPVSSPDRTATVHGPVQPDARGGGRGGGGGSGGHGS